MWPARRVRRVDCGFLQRSWAGWVGDRGSTGGEATISPDQRRLVREGDAPDQSDQVRCWLGIIDVQAGLDVQVRHTRWGMPTPEHAAAVAANLTQLRSCRYFYRYQPG